MGTRWPTGADLLITGARRPGSGQIGDLRITGGRVAAADSSPTTGPDHVVVEADGRWLVPGLWDAHVHLGQWAQSADRLDVGDTRGPADVTRRVAEAVDADPGRSGRTIWGQGYRSAPWPRQPTVAELDAVSGSRPVVLISGDAHNGWLNSAALGRLGLAGRTAPLEENEWFAVLPTLQDLLGDGTPDEDAIGAALRAAHRRGVVGLVDFEFADNVTLWPERFARGLDTMRVRAATYPDRLDDLISGGHRHADPLVPGSDLLTTGPLKIISDGSLNTRTAYCCEPYVLGETLPAPRGTQNVGLGDLVALLDRAAEHGLEAAVHAIGDAAVDDALTAFERTGARGSVEHAQLVRREDLSRLAQLRLVASVQPAHLLDDRDVTQQYWSDRADRCFALRSMLDNGVRLALGSDAPVAPLDPWLAMAAAIHRSADDREPWNPAEAITASEALSASTDGRRLRTGEPGDVLLVDDDPLHSFDSTRQTADHLRAMRVAATVVAGRIVHTDGI